MQPDAKGFPALIGNKPRALVLGSMPGQASLGAQQYYAHPRNAFWWIAEQLFGIDATLPYSSRCIELQKQPLVLWDVLSECHRPGSLDSNIQSDSAQPNNFSSLLSDYPSIRNVFFNGATAENLFRRLVIPNLPIQQDLHRLTLKRLPSTSPAHASQSRERKLNEWRALLEALKNNRQDSPSPTIANTA